MQNGRHKKYQIATLQVNDFYSSVKPCYQPGEDENLRNLTRFLGIFQLFSLHSQNHIKQNQKGPLGVYTMICITQAIAFL